MHNLAITDQGSGTGVIISNPESLLPTTLGADISNFSADGKFRFIRKVA
jgi:hypothetical protein